MIAQTLRLFMLCLVTVLPQMTRAETSHIAPKLSVVGAFYSGAAPRKMARLHELSLAHIRDGLRWGDVVGPKRAHQFDKGSAANLSLLAQRRLLGPIMVLPQSPLFNNAQTVTTDQDIRAFAQYVKAVADHFSQSPIEVANEFNGGAFVSGAARKWPVARRAALHAMMLAQIAKAGVSRDRIIGGALHSMSGEYLWSLLDAGASAHMASVAIHPYTTAPEAFPRQMAFLRRHPEMARLRVDITEFGTRDTQGAADFFWRYYCQMALADVDSAYWYPLDVRKDGYAAVLNRSLDLTPVGRMITYAATKLAGQPVVQVRLDPFTYGCLFGNELLVLWGAEREVRVENNGLNIRRGDGRPQNGPVILSRERVILIEGAGIDVTNHISFAPQTMLFDSFDQFQYQTSTNPHQYLTPQGIRENFALCPGQDRPEAPWYPHLCIPDMPRAVLHDRGFVLPAKGAQFHTRYQSPRDANIGIQVDLDVNKNSEDGVEVIVLIDGREYARRRVEGKQDVRFEPFFTTAGTVIEVVLASGTSATVDQGKFRVQLREVTSQ